MSDLYTNAALPNQAVPLVDSQGRATRAFWLLLTAVFNRTGGDGSPVDAATLQAEIEALQQVAFVLAAIDKNLPNSAALAVDPSLTMTLTDGALTLALSVPVTVARGGTGLTSLTAHAVPVGNGASAPNFAAPGGPGQVLTSNGAAVDPSFQALPASVTSLLAGTGINVSAPTGNVTVSLQVPVTVANGGTGKTTASGASLDSITGFSGTGLLRRTGAGAYSFDAQSTYLQAANNLSDVASPATARTNLGLGTMATQAASAVAITGGAISGTPVSGSTGSFSSGGLAPDVTVSNANGNGAQVKMVGNGTVTPSKIFRVNSGALQVVNDAETAVIAALSDAGALSLSGGITTGSATLHSTSVALTDGAAAAAGTLTNAPAAGNPTKWIPINDNGTTRYIPAW